LLRSLSRIEQPTSEALEGYLSRARAARSWQNLLRVGSEILLIFSGTYMLFNRLYRAVLYNSWCSRDFWAVQRSRRAH
jgi:hypothetical protein